MLLPICFLAGVLNYLDRTNLTYAALELNSDLGFGPVDYGIGAGASRSTQHPQPNVSRSSQTPTVALTRVQGPSTWAMEWRTSPPPSSRCG